MKKVLVIGRLHLQYYVKQLNDPADSKGKRYAAELCATDKAMRRLRQGERFDAIVVPLYEDHGGELDPNKTDKGFLTGAVIIDEVKQWNPHTKFFLFGGANQSIVKAGDNIVFLPESIDMEIQELVERIDREFDEAKRATRTK